MLIEIGNTSPKNVADPSVPHVTYVNMPDGAQTLEPGMDVATFKAHQVEALTTRQGITHLPGVEALFNVLDLTGGLWKEHSDGPGSWVWSDDDEMQRFLREYWSAGERPANVEDTHQTLAGPPGVVPGAAVDLQMNITQNGRDMWARALGGGIVGLIGVGSAATSTTLTTTSTLTGTSNYNGQRLYAYTLSGNAIVYGIIVSNTSGANGVWTVDRWYTVATPGSAAGATPGTPWAWVVQDGNAPAWFMGLTANSSTPASPSTATSLTGEITTGGGGLIRAITTWAHTASANTYTLSNTFTANGTDSLPVTIAKIGVFGSMVVGDTTSVMLFEELLNATATLTASGDAVSIVETVTGT